MVKMNVDGAFARSGTKSAAAAFCRDSDGNYLGVSVTVFDGLSDPGTVESLAAREALSLAADLHLNRLQIASDCNEVVEDITRGTLGRYGAIVREIIARAAGFDKCSFIHERRNFNFEAHSLAKFASSLEVGRHLWLETPYDVFSVPMNILHE